MRDVLLIWVKEKVENFCEGDWTGGIALNCFNKFGVWRRLPWLR